ncbi:MAG: hypothetical protein ABIO61_03305 [Thermomonas sp.]
MKAVIRRNRNFRMAIIIALWTGIAGIALAITSTHALLQSRTAPTAAVTAPLMVSATVMGARAPSQTAKVRAAQIQQAVADGGLTTRNAYGLLRTVSRHGALNTDSAFFQSLGRNGRSCDTCHRLEAAWSITPSEVQARFAASGGTEPIFRTNDGSNSPLADVSTVGARGRAYSMLLRKGLIRVGLPIPANAEFTLANVDDPYQFASASELSLFRRPLPSTNLTFVTGLMWDGRETSAPFLPPMHAGQDHQILINSLIHQANSATNGHADGLDPTPEQLVDIVAFETELTTAQIHDDIAGYLNSDDALGGPRILAQQNFYVGINDTLGADPTGAIFDPGSMDLYTAWATPQDNSHRNRERASIARGEQTFNLRTFAITNVKGLNDALGVTSLPGTCTTCHNAPNVGNHTVTLPLDIGLTDASRRTSDMPLYTLRNRTTGATVRTTDPGLALVTGKWKDIARFKGPILRGLAARPPYFHNGLAASLEEVVDFYDTRFAMDLSQREKRDLVAFLRTL